MDGVEILGTMAAEGAPWWVFLSLVLGCAGCWVFAIIATDREMVASCSLIAVLLSVLLGMLAQQTSPEKQIALITDNASYTAIEAQYKVTKIDEHLYFLEVKDE